MLRKVQTPDSYWSQVFIALAQVTFGVAWGSLFLAKDSSDIIIVIANLLISAILILLGDFIRRRK